MEFQENYNHILKKNHRYMTKVKQAPTHIVPKSTTSKRKSVQKEFNFRFEFLKGDSENINFLNMKIEDFPKDDKKTLVKQQTSKIEKQTTSKFLDKNLMVDDMKSLQTDRININYKFIFQKISDYFMAIHNPEQILFRDEEIKEISEFIAQCLKNKTKQRNLLVSGKPGCGKTLSVTKTIENQIKCDENKKILFIKLNAMTFKNPLDVFEEIKTYFNEKKSKPSKIKKSLSEILKSQKEYENIILMIDEIDSLCTKYSSTQQDIFEIFKIANNPECKLILIGVSNSMELIYKIGKKCYANLEGMQNIVFKSYNFIQMMKIIQERIDDFISIQCNSQIDTKDILEENALKLCANRIYNLKGGDIRCILEVLMKSFSSQSEKINNSKSQCPEGFAISLSDLLNTFDELYNERKNDEIINSLPIFSQTVLLVIYFQFKNTPDINEIDLSKILCSFNEFCGNFYIQKQDIMGFRQMLKILESYKFIEVKQASKAKERNLGENCKIKILINLLEIKNTLNCHESFSKYF